MTSEHPITAETVVDHPGWAEHDVSEATVDAAAAALWKRLGTSGDTVELSILLSDDTRIQALNTQFRAKDQPTNVLSFPSDEDTYIGDIALALETVVREAADHQISVADHVTHLVIHGILHLLGHDHVANEDAEEMETIEVLVLKDLGIANPYATNGTAHRVSSPATPVTTVAKAADR